MAGVVNIFILSLLGSVFALIGGVVFLNIKAWSAKLNSYAVPFAAGVLITVSLIGLMPEALELSGEVVFQIVLLAFIGSYIFENFFVQIHHHEDGHQVISSVPLVIIGDTIHNFIDGVVIASAYLISPGLGVITTISTFLHEVPHEIGDFGIMQKAGYSKKRIVLINLYSSLTTLIGAGLVIMTQPSENILGLLMAFAAGVFLYLGASDFLPEINKSQDSRKSLLTAFILGVILMFLTAKIVPHSHATHSQDDLVELIDSDHDEKSSDY